MKFTTSAAMACLLAFVSQSQAAIIYSASLLSADGSSNDALVTESSGTLLASGYAGTGTFSLSDFQVEELLAMTTSQSFAMLESHFIPFGTDNFVLGTEDAYGTTQLGSYVITAEFIPTASQIGSTIYTFIGNGSSLATSTQFGVIKYGVLTADPAAPALENSYDLGVTNGTIIEGTSGTTILNNSDLGIDNVMVKSLALAPMNLAPTGPEPSGALLGLLGLAGLVRRRR